MLIRVVGEVLIGLTAAGLVLAMVVPASMQLGYEPGAWLAWAVAGASIVGCVAMGERMNRRRKARESP